MAGPFDFTGQNIEDTYERVVQTDGTNFYDGTGSAISIVSSKVNLISEVGTNTNYELTFGSLPLGGGGSFLRADGNPSTTNRLSYNPSTNTLNTFNLEAKNNLTTLGSITASGNISASGTIYAGLSTGTSNTVVISDNGELKTDNVDSKIFGNNLVDYTATLSPVTPASRQLAIWSSAGTIRGYDGLTASSDGIITATAISASLSAANISYIGFLDVTKLRINGVIVGQYISNNTVLGNAVDTKTIIESPKLEVNDLDVLGNISGTVDGGKF